MVSGEVLGAAARSTRPRASGRRSFFIRATRARHALRLEPGQVLGDHQVREARLAHRCRGRGRVDRRRVGRRRRRRRSSCSSRASAIGLERRRCALSCSSRPGPARALRRRRASRRYRRRATAGRRGRPGSSGPKLEARGGFEASLVAALHAAVRARRIRGTGNQPGRLSRRARSLVQRRLSRTPNPRHASRPPCALERGRRSCQPLPIRFCCWRRRRRGP